MTNSEKIITHVRNYCLELYKNGFSTQQYIAKALLNGVLYLTGKSYDDYDKLKSDIIKLGTENLKNETTAFSKKGHLNKIESEKNNFIQFVSELQPNELKNISPIKFKRRLTNEESLKIKTALKQKWDFNSWKFDNYYWEPLVKTKAENTFFFDVDFLDDTDYEKIAEIISSDSGKTIYHLNEDKVDFELDPALFNDDYWESVFTDKNHNWIIYFSHEGTVAFGGKSLIDKIDLELPKRVEIKNTWK